MASCPRHGGVDADPEEDQSAEHDRQDQGRGPSQHDERKQDAKYPKAVFSPSNFRTKRTELGSLSLVKHFRATPF